MADPAELIATLRAQTQLDMDGCHVGVSRQAVDEAIEILAALSPAPTVPEGWRLVPVEPTDAMIRAFWGADVTVDYNWTEEYKLKIRGTGKYRAMLAASPQPPVSEGWRDIASAPRDGTEVLIFKNGNVYNAVWKDEANLGECETGPAWEVFECDMDCWYSVSVTNPTHWQPLPAPPAAPEAGR